MAAVGLRCQILAESLTEYLIWWNPGKLVENIFYTMEKICQMSTEISSYF